MSDITELVGLDVERVDGVAEPANGTPFILFKSIAQGGNTRMVAKSVEVPAVGGPGEADAIQESVTGERSASARCGAVTAEDGTPCQRIPAPGSTRCHHHAAKEMTVTKVLNNPTKALRRLEKAVADLPAHHPVRLQGNQIITFHRLLAARRGLAKGVGAVDPDQARVIKQAIADAEAARPTQRDVIASVADGTAEAQSLAGHPGTDRQAVANMQTNAVSGQGFIKALEQAQAEFNAARQGNDPRRLEKAGYDLSLLKLTALHEGIGLAKGDVQAALNGTATPEATGSLTSTSGRLTPATGAPIDRAPMLPATPSSAGGVLDRLQGGEAAYGIPAEARAAAEGVLKAQAAFDRARETGNSNDIDRCGYDLTLAKLTAAHIRGEI